MYCLTRDKLWSERISVVGILRYSILLADKTKRRIIVLDRYNFYMDNKGHIQENKSLKKREDGIGFDNIVLEKDIFSNVFEKDIRRVYVYKKSEMIAKAIHFISPGFKDSKALRDRMHRISVEIIDASILPPAFGRETLSRELLTLSSILRLAKSTGMLSHMNADIITREASELLQEIASYEDQKVALEETPSLALLARNTSARIAISGGVSSIREKTLISDRPDILKGQNNKRQKEVKKDKNGRKEAILSILKSKGPSYIKDLSTLIREVSEKTIQRELQALVLEGKVSKTGERRWTMYSIVGSVSDTALKSTSTAADVDFTLALG